MTATERTARAGIRRLAERIARLTADDGEPAWAQKAALLAMRIAAAARSALVAEHENKEGTPR
jgi:hypothetical protein